MTRIKPVVASLVFAASTAWLVASGPIGVYGIVEKVVFEPSASAPERIQVWGAFAYAGDRRRCNRVFCGEARLHVFPNACERDSGSRGDDQEGMGRLAVSRGHRSGDRVWQLGLHRRVWRVAAGHAQQHAAVPFEYGPGNPQTDLRVRPASEAPAGPAQYQTNAGIVKLAATGSHAAIIQQLRDALKR